MKNINLLFLCFIIGILFSGLTTTAQDQSHDTFTGKIGVYVSPFGSNLVYWPDDLVGTGGYDNDGSLAFGLNYMQGITRWLEFETGLDYSVHHTIYDPPFNGGDYISPSRKETVALVSVPLTLRANFLRYFFVNGGVQLDFDVSKSNSVDDQTGIATVFGVGAQYGFRSGFAVYVNPFFKVHSMLALSPERYQQRIWESGMRVGVTYDFGKKNQDN